MKEWRRRHNRIKCFNPPGMVIPIHLHIESDRKMDGWGVILDISLGGVGIETRASVKDRQTVYVSFTLAESFIFSNAKAIIRHIVNNGLYNTCGIEFDSLVDRKHLEEALAMMDENADNKREVL